MYDLLVDQMGKHLDCSLAHYLVITLVCLLELSNHTVNYESYDVWQFGVNSCE